MSSYDRILQVQRELDELEYDFSAISHDDVTMEVTGVTYKTPSEIREQRRCICLDALFYAFDQLESVEGVEGKILSLNPIEQFSGQNPPLIGIGHALLLFEHDGKIGAIGKSREEKLEFQKPKYDGIDDLIMNSNVIEGYSNLQRNKWRPLVGLVSVEKNILEIHPEFRTEPYISDEKSEVNLEAARKSLKIYKFDKNLGCRHRIKFVEL